MNANGNRNDTKPRSYAPRGSRTRLVLITGLWLAVLAPALAFLFSGCAGGPASATASERAFRS